MLLPECRRLGDVLCATPRFATGRTTKDRPPKLLASSPGVHFRGVFLHHHQLEECGSVDVPGHSRSAFVVARCGQQRGQVRSGPSSDVSGGRSSMERRGPRTRPAFLSRSTPDVVCGTNHATARPRSVTCIVAPRDTARTYRLACWRSSRSPIDSMCYTVARTAYRDRDISRRPTGPVTRPHARTRSTATTGRGRRPPPVRPARPGGNWSSPPATTGSSRPPTARRPADAPRSR